MEVQSDHGLLVVSLDSCISSEASCDLGKPSSCIYTAAMTGGACGHEPSVVQLATPVQCIGDIRQSLTRIQPQHLTQLQPIQYSQTVSYEPSQALQPTSLIANQTLYQPMSVSTNHLHYPSSNPYLPPLPILTPSPSFSAPPPPPSDEDFLTTEPVECAAPPASEPTYPAEGFDYFMEIQNYLVSEQWPPGVSDSYKKCLKKRAQNYVMIDGKLHHSRKQPKEVIMRKDQQEDMLTDIHIVKETGVHLGVKKMFNSLHTKYFWRGMYTDVVNFVRKCDKCSDNVQDCRRKTTRGGGEVESDDSETVEDPPPLSPNPGDQPSLSHSTIGHTRVWRKVEVQVHGPYQRTVNRNEFLLTMADPDSRWCCARPVPSAGLPTLLADFVFHCFCNYGFARCSLVGCAPDLTQAANKEYSSRVSKLGGVFSSASLESMVAQQQATGWVTPMLERLVEAHPTKWDKYLDHFLFQYRIGELKEFEQLSSESPFSILFSHNPLGFSVPDEDKENINENHPGYRLRHRKSSSTLLQCRHCTSVFTSKISFRLHLRRHSGECGHKKHILSRKRLAKPRNDVSGLSGEGEDGWRESTVSAVKALLEATKEDRRRRGKYHKYSLELQEQMATYAFKHGNQQAVRFFSEKLGTAVSESTIRNLVKTHYAFTANMKEEIGKFAASYGVESAAKSFSEWLKRDVSLNLVRKFKSLYLYKRSRNTNMDRHLKLNDVRESLIYNKPSGSGPLKKKRYTIKLKEEIGEYACNHSVEDTVKHFSEKLNAPVKERTVKRFYKSYLDKCQNHNSIDTLGSQKQVLEVRNDDSSRVDVYSSFQETVPVTVYQVSQCPSTNSSSCYQTTASSSLITSQSNTSFDYQTLQSFSTALPTVAVSQPPPYPLAVFTTSGKVGLTNIAIQQQNQSPQSCLLPQHSLLVAQDRGTVVSHFMATQQPLQQTILTIIPDKEPLSVGENHDMESRFNSETYQEKSETVPLVTELLTEQEKEQGENVLEHEVKNPNYNNVKGVTKKVSKTQPKSEVKKTLSFSKKRGLITACSPKKRGSYTAYSPEIRAEIGKYAAEHGSVKACQHFAQILGHEIPESTARGLKEKYLLKKQVCPVTSLGYSQRGRPLRLGKYDQLVQNCLKELVRSGEKVSSFLAITTAKHILNKYEPALLEENGGSLKLNTTWAKSFLKRIGVHNNS